MARRARMSHPFDDLRPHRHLRLTTYRASGEAVPTPVWFVCHDGALYIKTGAHTGKVRRVQRNPRVTIAPSTSRGTPRGADLPALAEDVGQKVPAAVHAAFLRRYGILQRIRDFLVGRRRITPTFLKVTSADGGSDPFHVRSTSE
ncbi:PPOX class F420-dependent oxidoreductase [Nonomuraea sp. NBC_00507]|uniref:PPOX class F420-dependent oxidoreductase n=1 Tax=Nonomuraea sp. NBC_00507 TaxID=2976002 RepID=UPI002E19BFDE